MLTKSQIAQGALLVFAVVHDIRTQMEAKAAARLYLEALDAHEEIVATQDAQMKYLCHLLDDHEIALDEFDMIALSNPM